METVLLSQFVYRGSIGTLGQRFEDLLEMFDLYLMANKTAEEKKKTIFLFNKERSYSRSTGPSAKRTSATRTTRY